jgi:hypothetical protein
MGQCINIVELLLRVREARARRPPPAYYVVEVDGLDIHVPTIGHADTMPEFMRLVGSAAVEDDADGFDVGQFMAWYDGPELAGADSGADGVAGGFGGLDVPTVPTEPTGPAGPAGPVGPKRPSRRKRARPAVPPKTVKPAKRAKAVERPVVSRRPVVRTIDPSGRQAAMAKMLSAPGVDVDPGSDVVAELDAMVKAKKRRFEQVVEQVRTSVADTVAGIRRGEKVADLLDRLRSRHGGGRLLLLVTATSLDDPSRLWAEVDRRLLGSGVSDTRGV